MNLFLYLLFPITILATTANYGSVSYESGNGDFDMAQMLTLLNQNRASASAGPLVIDSRLFTSASNYCQTMINTNCFEHTCGPVPSFTDRITNVGFSWSAAAENIAEGQTSTAQVMTEWMNSTGHRANILNGAYTRVGLAFCQSYKTTYWVQDFGSESAYSNTGSRYVVDPVAPQGAQVQPTQAQVKPTQVPAKPTQVPAKHPQAQVHPQPQVQDAHANQIVTSSHTTMTKVTTTPITKSIQGLGASGSDPNHSYGSNQPKKCRRKDGTIAFFT